MNTPIKEPCEYCSATYDCDCKERIGCSRQGEPLHTQCGRCPDCGTPRFQGCEHERARNIESGRYA